MFYYNCGKFYIMHYIKEIGLYVTGLCIVSTEKVHELEKASQPYVDILLIECNM